MLRYLMDENVNPVYINQLRRRESDLIIRAVGEPDTPQNNRGNSPTTSIRGVRGKCSCFETDGRT
ncbi:MAG: hypothetical protein EAZ79_09920 [Oscillatoriales cyanobacterium]|nr:MAG: hypothetical protein EAZ79_09920 [Oscillatoriales cyanobacterium]